MIEVTGKHHGKSCYVVYLKIADCPYMIDHICIWLLGEIEVAVVEIDPYFTIRAVPLG